MAGPYTHSLADFIVGTVDPTIVNGSGQVTGGIIPVVDVRNGGGAGALSAGTDRSGTATTTASTLAPANANRVSLKGQNVSGVNIGINEVGGAAAIGTAGTYTIAPGGSFSINTNRAVSVIAASGTAAYTATET